MLTLAITLISLALVFYTLGIGAERFSGALRWRQVAAFAVGLGADLSGTGVMRTIAGAGGPTGVEQNPLLTQVMAVTGLLALLLMGFHLAWAVAVLVRNRPREKAVFHRFSLAVWAVWLIPYVTGMAAAMV